MPPTAPPAAPVPVPVPVSPPGTHLPRRAAALFEQALVSGANLVAFVLLARALTPEAWGGFGLAWALVLFLQGVQRALVTLPMISFDAADPAAPAHGRRWAALNTTLALAGTALLLAAAGTATLATGGWWVQSLAMAAVLLLPMMAHEYARRTAVQAGRGDLLTTMGAAYASVLVGVALLALPAALRPWQPAAAAALAAAAAAALCRWRGGLVVLTRPGRPPRVAGYAGYGGWALGGHLAYSGYHFGVQALLAALAGPAAMGAFHACRTLVQPVATLQAAMDSIDKPRAAAALAREGGAGLRRVLWRTLVTVALPALPWLALVAWAAGPLLVLAYGDTYGGQQAVVWAWCVAALCAVLSQPVESGLYVAQRTRALFLARALASAASLGAALLLIPAQGAAGALAAVALGYTLAAAGGLCALRGLAAPAPSPINTATRPKT